MPIFEVELKALYMNIIEAKDGNEALNIAKESLEKVSFLVVEKGTEIVRIVNNG